MDYEFVWTIVLLATIIAGMVLTLNGAVQLAVRNKTRPWKDGGAKLLAGIIVAGVPLDVVLWLASSYFPPPPS